MTGKTSNEADATALATAYQRASDEYGWCRDAIAKYDDHLFRIRSWNMTLTIAIIGGYIGLSKEGGVSFSASTMVLVAVLAGCGFWLLDAMTKSLQMVHIYGSRDLERYLRGDDAKGLVTPTIALRFTKKQGRHLRPAIKNLTEESVWPFYLLPMALAGTLALVRSRAGEGCWPFGDAGCEMAKDVWLAGIAAAIVALLLVFSRAWNSEKPARRYLAGPWRARRWRAAERARMLIRTVEGVKADRARRFWAYKADACCTDAECLGDRFVLFVDSESRRQQHAYLAERRRSLTAIGYTVLEIDERRVGDPLVDLPFGWNVTVPGDRRIGALPLEVARRVGIYAADELPAAGPGLRR